MNNKIDQVPDEFKQLADDFSKNGINLILEPPIYPNKYNQLYKNAGFLNDLSVVDIIMNCGKEWENYC